MPDYNRAINKLVKFQGLSLTERLRIIEEELKGKNSKDMKSKNRKNKISRSLLDSALTVKGAISQLNVIIHAVGILLSLSYILLKNEKILYLSLGAGNTGKNFDLETNKKVAEFKFINWQNKSNTIRENSLFIDFYNLAEYKTKKRKVLYVLELERPKIFFQGNRAISSVLSKNVKIKREFDKKFGNKYKRVSDYYNYRKNSVDIVDLNTKVPNLPILGSK